MNRIKYLDGLRGVAILLVIFYHAYFRWPELVPYGNAIADIPLIKFGYLGVQLFFILSGFVIFMTLERCSNPKTFLWRRWLRLFPAMLICSILIFCTSEFFSERPAGNPNWVDLLPGLTFIDPHLFGKLTTISASSLEGAFWSLYVEFKFYVLAACFYFLFGAKRLFALILSCYLCWLSSELLVGYVNDNIIKYLTSISANLAFKYFGWFAIGMAFYLSESNRSVKWFVFGIALSIFCIITNYWISPVEGEFIALLLIVLLFAAPMKFSKVRDILSHRALLFLGFVSYPLYLVHENIMISITIKLGHYFPTEALLITPIFGFTLVVCIAWYVTKYVEPFVKQKLKTIKEAIQGIKYSMPVNK